ncbi:hypothetical protein D3C73_953630 [compost metagenome]
MKASGLSVSCTRRLTSVSSSLKRRSRSLREVTHLPSLPAKGLLFTRNVICIVGSSIFRTGSASGFCGSAIVSPMLISLIPAIATMSPAPASSVSTRFRPWKPKSFSMRAVLLLPSRMMTVTDWPCLITPRFTRPIAIRPRYSL